MKLDFVVPRYGPVGGAENAVSALAKRVAKHTGWEVHLHATCAIPRTICGGIAPSPGQ